MTFRSFVSFLLLVGCLHGVYAKNLVIHHEDGSETMFLDPIYGPEETKSKEPPRHGSGWEDGVSRGNNAEQRAKAEAKAKADAIAKATAAQKAAEKEGRDASHALALRLDDLPLENDSYVVEKLWDRLKGLFVSNVVGSLLKSLTPSESGTTVFDSAKTPQEMKGVRYDLEQDLLKAKAEKLKNGDALKNNENTLQLNPSEIRIFDGGEGVRFQKAMRDLASLRSADAAFVVDQLMTRGRRDSELPISSETIGKIVLRLQAITPANACNIPPRGWSCPLYGSKLTDGCMCPGLGIGKAKLLPVSEFCSGATTNCRLSTSLPVGTPCNCNADFRISGPIPFGKVIDRNKLRMRQ